MRPIPNKSWTIDQRTEHNTICFAAGTLGMLMRRVAGLEPPPPTFRGGGHRCETLITDLDLPPGYAVALRRENPDDPGVYRCMGPRGWEQDTLSKKWAENVCWTHFNVCVNSGEENCVGPTDDATARAEAAYAEMKMHEEAENALNDDAAWGDS